MPCVAVSHSSFGATNEEANIQKMPHSLRALMPMEIVSPASLDYYTPRIILFALVQRKQNDRHCITPAVSITVLQFVLLLHRRQRGVQLPDSCSDIRLHYRLDSPVLIIDVYIMSYLRLSTS